MEHFFRYFSCMFFFISGHRCLPSTKKSFARDGGRSQQVLIPFSKKLQLFYK